MARLKIQCRYHIYQPVLLDNRANAYTAEGYPCIFDLKSQFRRDKKFTDELNHYNPRVYIEIAPALLQKQIG